MMEFKEALTEVLRRQREWGSYVSEKAICPQCGGTVQFEWSGNWTRVLSARCLGEEVGWEKYANSCGFAEKDLETDTSRVDAWNERRMRGKLDPGERAGDNAVSELIKWLGGEEIHGGDE